jgi:putative peptidoglycan lipid II flippase
MSVEEEQVTEASAGLARSASVLALGSAASRALGLGREMVIAALFGATGEVSAFRVASQVPVLLYDFLVGGMLSAALVPVLSHAAHRRDRRGFAQLVSVLATWLGLALAVATAAIMIAAPQVAGLLVGGFRGHDPALFDLTVRLIRWTAPVVWLLSLAGLTTAALYALQRFTFPAAATAIYNLGIVVAAPLLAARLGIGALVVGVLAGAAAQLAVMLFDLRRAGVVITLRPEWRHPALAQIGRLYAPIAAGLVVALFQVGLDRRLASATGSQSIAWMANATTLQQMPLGLVSVAISLAALPRLSQYVAAGDEAAYRATLGHGLRLVLLLMAPAAVLLWTLGAPLTRLLFERGRFAATDTAQVVAALNIYVVGMLFAAVDYPLNFAFYARNNTWLPALVGVVSVGVYVVAALAFLQPLGYLGLVWADTAKQAGHALIMAALIGRTGGVDWRTLGRGMRGIGLAGTGLAGTTWVITQGVKWRLPDGMLRDGALLALAVGSGLLVYALLLRLSGVGEIDALLAAARRRLRRSPVATAPVHE